MIFRTNYSGQGSTETELGHRNIPMASQTHGIYFPRKKKGGGGRGAVTRKKREEKYRKDKNNGSYQTVYYSLF